MANANTPVTFELPDGDTVALITWGYVVERLSEPLNVIIASISSINQSLTKIDTKLDTWIED